MQVCSQCSADNPETHRFCKKCGHQLNNICPVCQFNNLITQEFCGSCGSQLLKDTPVGTQKQSQSTEAVAEGDARHSSGSVSVMAEPKADDPKQADEEDTLAEYAVASLVLTNWQDLAEQAADQTEIENAKQACQTSMGLAVAKFNGELKPATQQIFFARFCFDANTAASVDNALSFAQALLENPPTWNGQKVIFKMGIDLEHRDEDVSITATTERTVAQAGQVVVSERIHQAHSPQFKTDPIEPVTIAGNTVQYYKLTPISPAEHTSRDTQATVPINDPAPANTPMPNETPDEILSSKSLYDEMGLNTDPIDLSSAPPAEKIAPSIDAILSEEESDDAEAPAEQVNEEAAGNLAGTSAPLSEEDPQPEAPLESSSHPTHDPSLADLLPSHKQFGSTRLSNISYQEAVQALTTEFENFTAQANAKMQVVSLYGSNGLGKSQLIQMARDSVDPENNRFHWLGASCYKAFQQNQLPLKLWFELLENMLGLFAEGQRYENTREQIDQFINLIYKGQPDEELQTFLHDVFATTHLDPLSIDSKENMGRFELHLAQLLTHLSQERPVVLVLEDLDNVDDASLIVLKKILDLKLNGHNILLLLTGPRNLHFSETFQESIRLYPYKELMVSDLSDAEMETFLDEGPLGGSLNQFPQSLTTQIINYAQGIPLKLEECLRYLFNEEYLTVDEVTGKFHFNLESDISGLTIPDQLTALIADRVSYLTDNSRYALQLASVIGEKFPVSLLHSLTQFDEDEFNHVLQNLYDHGFLVPDAVNTGRFRHSTLWQIVYVDIPSNIKLQLHQLISQTLEEDYENGVAVNPAIIAYHAQQSEFINRALNYWNLTAVHAAQVGSLAGLNMALLTVMDYLSYQQINKEVDDRQVELAYVQENLAVFNLEEHTPLATNLLETVADDYQQSGQYTNLIQVLGFLTQGYEIQGLFEDAINTLDHNINLVPMDTYPLEHTSLLVNKLEYYVTLGHYGQGIQFLNNAVKPALQDKQLQQDPDVLQTQLQSTLLEATLRLNRCDTGAFTQLEEAIPLAQEKDWEEMSLALELLQAKGWLYSGEFNACDDAADALLDRIEALPNGNWFLTQWGLLAMMFHNELGAWDSCEQLIMTIVSKAEELLDYPTWITAQNFAGYCYLGQGNLNRARQLLTQSLVMAERYSLVGCQIQAHQYQAELHLALEDPAAAEKSVRTALTLSQRSLVDALYAEYQLTILLAQCLIQQDNTKEAGPMLEALWPRVVKTQFKKLMAQTAFAIGGLYKASATTAPSETSRKHLQRSIQFYQKAHGLWLDMGNAYEARRTQNATPRV